jgi:hypothetical protein
MKDERIEAYAAAYPGAGQRMGKGQNAAGQGGAAARAYASRRALLLRMGHVTLSNGGSVRPGRERVALEFQDA